MAIMAMSGIPIVSLLCLLVCPIAVVAAIMLFRRRKGPTHPICGKCGYAVRGLPTFTCPECGSDLREVGISMPGTRRELGPVARILIWTILLPIPALPISAVVATFIPFMHVTEISRTIVCQYGHPDATFRVEMESRVLAWTSSLPTQPVPPQKMTLHLENTTAPALTIDLATGGYRYTDKNGQTVEKSSGFGQEALADWMQAAGIDTTDPITRDKVKDILFCINETPNAKGKFTNLAPDPALGGTNTITAQPSVTSVSFESLKSTLWLILTFWLLVWLAGIWRILRRRPSTAS